MLVNVLTRYRPRPVVVLELARLENRPSFGAHVIEPTARRLRPARVQNSQIFGSNRAGHPLRFIAPVRVVNTETFGAASIANLSSGARTLAPVRVTNAAQFGASAISATSAAVSAMLPSDLDTTFIDAEGVARSSIAGGAFVNLDA
jgi:hypothetical protein